MPQTYKNEGPSGGGFSKIITEYRTEYRNDTFIIYGMCEGGESEEVVLTILEVKSVIALIFEFLPLPEDQKKALQKRFTQGESLTIKLGVGKEYDYDHDDEDDFEYDDDDHDDEDIASYAYLDLHFNNSEFNVVLKENTIKVFLNDLIEFLKSCS